MRKSVIVKILAAIASVLFITDSALLLLGYSTVSATVRKSQASYAKAAASAAADLLYGVDMEKLRTDEAYAKYYRSMLEDLGRTNDLVYLYVYIPNPEKQTITYVMLICGENSSDLAAQERIPGTVTDHMLSQSELLAWNKSRHEDADDAGSRFRRPEDEDEAGRLEETDNEYGHVLTAHSAVYDQAGDPVALVGADVSMDEVLQIFFRRYRIMFAAVVFSFVFVLGILAVILKTRVLKPAGIISRRMRNFVSDRESAFEKVEIKGSDEFAQMADAFNNMAQDIDRYIRDINILTEEKHRQEAEIGIAANIQKGFLPEENCQSHGIRLTAAMVPARYVGGDFYDYFSLTDDVICTVIADVSGKGISAALFMARAVTVVRQYARLGYSPSEILFYTNQALAPNNPEQMFLTAFIGIYHSSSRRYVYANGGHNFPYLLSCSESEKRACAGSEDAGERAVRKLDDVSGMTVGIFEDETYGEGEIVLKEGDIVFMYTDGVNEAVNQDKEFFGTDRLERILRENGEVETVLDAVREFAKGTQQSDDITMLSFCVQPDGDKESGVCAYMKVTAEVKNLGQVQDFILQNRSIPAGRKKKLCLAAEEIFVNICSYAYGQKQGDVEISIQVSDEITIEFADEGKEFNPLLDLPDMENYDLDTRIGGIGRQIAFDLADRADYRYMDHKNILTLIFR